MDTSREGISQIVPINERGIPRLVQKESFSLRNIVRITITSKKPSLPFVSSRSSLLSRSSDESFQTSA